MVSKSCKTVVATVLVTALSSVALAAPAQAATAKDRVPAAPSYARSWR